MWFEKWPKPQLFEVQEAEGEVGSPIVVDWCFTVFDEASAIVRLVPRMRGLSKAGIVLYGCFQATSCMGHIGGSFAGEGLFSSLTACELK